MKSRWPGREVRTVCALQHVPFYEGVSECQPPVRWQRLVTSEKVSGCPVSNGEEWAIGEYPYNNLIPQGEFGDVCLDLCNAQECCRETAEVAETAGESDDKAGTVDGKIFFL